MSQYADLGQVHAYVGPLAARPSPQVVGEGAFYTAPDDNDTLYQVITGNWVKVSRGQAAAATYG